MVTVGQVLANLIKYVKSVWYICLEKNKQTSSVDLKTSLRKLSVKQQQKKGGSQVEKITLKSPQSFPSQRIYSSKVTDGQKSPTHIKIALDFMKILEFSRSYKTVTIRFLGGEGGEKYMLLFYFTSWQLWLLNHFWELVVDIPVLFPVQAKRHLNCMKLKAPFKFHFIFSLWMLFGIHSIQTYFSYWN